MMKKYKCTNTECHYSCELRSDLFPHKCVCWDYIPQWVEMDGTEPVTEGNQLPKLPDWCKVGEWVYYRGYRKIIKIKAGAVVIESAHCDSLTVYPEEIGKTVFQARLRPYNAEEMKALVGKVIEVEPWQFSLCMRVKGLWADFLDDCDNEDDIARIISYDCDMLKHRNTIDGQPCGKLEHLENGEWVK